MTHNITIIGAGNVGGALGATLAARGHRITFGVREAGAAAAAIALAGGQAAEANIAEAVADAELIVLAVPGNVAADVAADLPVRDGAIIVDATNPLRWESGPVWTPPTEGSNAAAIAARLPHARVVKAFNTFGAEFHADPTLPGGGATVFIAGDDSDARAVVRALADDAGFTGVESGPLRNASVLENTAILWIHLAMAEGRGRGFALVLRDR